MATDQSQAVVWQTEQTPFGEVTQTTGTLAQPPRFPGQYADPETGYSYNYFRDYDPSVGRYVQSDPIGLDGGINTYGYALQNSINNYDPKGLDVICGNNAVWIEQGDGHGYCRPTREQGPQCFGGDCTGSPSHTNSQCMIECMGDPSNAPACPGLPFGGLVAEVIWDTVCQQGGHYLNCTIRCSEETTEPENCPE